MYESTERVSDRKVAFNRANSSLCMAIIAGQAVAASWTLDKDVIDILASVSLLFVSLLGFIFCLYWRSQLQAFKNLNSAKFKVLQEMSNHVAFPDYRERSIKSYNPFEREYEIMEQAKALRVTEGRRIALSSFSENLVPASFLAFFVFEALVCIYWTVLQLIPST